MHVYTSIETRLKINLKISFRLIIVLWIVQISTALQAKVLDLESIYTADISKKTNRALEQINTAYGDITHLITIGTSAQEGAEIKAIRLGKGDKHILINAGHHGREALTTILTLHQIDYLAEAYSNDEKINGYDVRAVLNTVSIWFVPLVNPDGADLAMSTLPSWKANGRGVDLNRNYPTLYATMKLSKAPGAEGYAGTAPFSEMETQAIRDLCYEKDFETAIAYHSAGEVIYWWYHQKGEVYDKSIELARMLSGITGYALVPSSKSTGGLGFTDWFIQKFSRPSFTLEIGKTVNQKPLEWREYLEIWKKNKNIPLQLAFETMKMNTASWETTINKQIITAETVFKKGVVPIREVSHIMDLSYQYDAKNKTITISKADQTLIIILNEKEALHNNETIILPTPAYEKNGISYVPLRTILDLFSDIETDTREQEELANEA